MKINRPSARLPAHLMRTYGIRAPRSTHTRPASCAEVRCPAMTHGWTTTVDERADLGASQAYYVRKQSGRSFTEEKLPDGRTSFTFPAGQSCFQSGQHVVSLDRPPVFLRRGGDWRGNPRGESATFRRPELWVESCAEDTHKIVRRIQEG